MLRDRVGNGTVVVSDAMDVFHQGCHGLAQRHFVGRGNGQYVRRPCRILGDSRVPLQADEFDGAVGLRRAAPRTTGQTQDERDDEQDQEHDEQDLCDLRRNHGYAAKAQKAGNNGDNQKC